MEKTFQGGKNKEFLDRFSKIVKKVGGNEEAAKIVGKSAPSIVRYKRGNEMPFEAVIRLVQCAGVSIEWLVSGEKEKGTSVRPLSHMDVEVVESAATALYDYLEKQDRVMEAIEFGKTVALICDLSKDPEDINVELIDRLMRFKGDI